MLRLLVSEAEEQDTIFYVFQMEQAFSWTSFPYYEHYHIWSDFSRNTKNL